MPLNLFRPDVLHRDIKSYSSDYGNTMQYLKNSWDLIIFIEIIRIEIHGSITELMPVNAKWEKEERKRSIQVNKKSRRENIFLPVISE